MEESRKVDYYDYGPILAMDSSEFRRPLFLTLRPAEFKKHLTKLKDSVLRMRSHGDR
jgi:hypothetical protein